MPSSSSRSASAVSEPRAPGERRTGQWLYAGHVLTVWALALSNALQGLAIVWTGFHRERLRGLWRWGRPLLLPLGLYVVFLAVSVVTSLEPATSAPALREGLALLTLPLGLALVRGEREVRRIFDLLIGVIAVLAVYGIAQHYLGGYGGIHNRIRGPFSHYQTFAGVLLLGDLLLVARMTAGEAWRKAWSWAALAAINWTLLLTLTRGPWLALAVTLSAYLLLRSRRLFVVFAAFALVVLLVGPAAWSARIRSIFDPRDPSNYDRLCMTQAGLFMVSERPLFGLGPGMVESRYPIYRHPTAPRFSVPHLHNTFLELAAERGLASLAAYLWLMAAGFGLAYRGYRRSADAGGEPSDLYLGVLLGVVGFNLAGLFEDNWRDTEVQRLMLLLLAAPLCLRRRPRPAPTMKR